MLKDAKIFENHLKPCHVGIDMIAITEYFKMNIYVPGFQSFLGFLHHFVLAKLATSNRRIKIFSEKCIGHKEMLKIVGSAWALLLWMG